MLGVDEDGRPAPALGLGQDGEGQGTFARALLAIEDREASSRDTGGADGPVELGRTGVNEGLDVGGQVRGRQAGLLGPKLVNEALFEGCALFGRCLLAGHFVPFV